MELQKEKEHMNGLENVNIKGNGRITKCMGKDNLLGKKEKCIQDNQNMTNFMDKDNINGKMEKFIMEDGIKDFSMEKVKYLMKTRLHMEYGKKEKKYVKQTKKQN